MVGAGWLVAGCEIEDVARLVDEARCDLRVGILSDVHITDPNSCGMLRKALKFFATRRVDAVIVAGDLTDNGYIGQLRSFGQTWSEVFRNDCDSSGKHVEKIFVTGNHDWIGWTYTAKGRKYRNRPEIGQSGALVSDPDQMWREVFHEPWQPVFTKTVNGYDFIGAHYLDGFSVESRGLRRELERQQVKTAAGESRPFFYVQHLVLQGTCCPNCGTWGAYDGGKTSVLLGRHPRCVAFCGHSHTPLTDDSSYWRGAFTCVNTGSLKYFCTAPGHDNGFSLSDTETFRQQQQLPRLNVHDNLAGLVMSVYGERVVLERWDMSHLEKVGPDWESTNPALDVERARCAVPQFAEDVRPVVVRGADTLSVQFPPARTSSGGVRAYDYEVKVVDAAGCERGRKLVYSPAFLASEAHETEGVRCLFRLSELGGDLTGCRVCVVPRNAWCQGLQATSPVATIKCP